MDFKPTPYTQKATQPIGDSVAFENRRNKQRASASGEILIAWHHESDVLRAYPTLDISENGARIIVDCQLPDGLSGLTLVHRPTGIQINRPSIVAWCRAVRLDDGTLLYYQAGIRFF